MKRTSKNHREGRQFGLNEREVKMLASSPGTRYDVHQYMYRFRQSYEGSHGQRRGDYQGKLLERISGDDEDG